MLDVVVEWLNAGAAIAVAPVTSLLADVGDGKDRSGNNSMRM